MPTQQTTDGPRAGGAPRVQSAGTGVQRIEFRPAWPSSGFDPNFPVNCKAGDWRVVGTWVETRGDHAPEGATFAGRHDPADSRRDTAPEQQPNNNTTHNTTTLQQRIFVWEEELNMEEKQRDH